MLWTERQRGFGQDKRDSLTAQCPACAYRFACNGGCPKHRFATSRDGEAGHNYFCESYTIFFAMPKADSARWRVSSPPGSRRIR
jgi:uncharacterized protein